MACSYCSLSEHISHFSHLQGLVHLELGGQTAEHDGGGRGDLEADVAAPRHAIILVRIRLYKKSSRNQRVVPHLANEGRGPVTSLLRAGLGDEEPAASGGRGPGHDALLTPGPRARQGAVTREALESECVTEMLATSGMNKQGGTESVPSE